MAVEYLGTGNDDGVILGRSATDKVSFYGGTPVVQQTLTTTAMTTMATTAATSTSPFGFTEAQANAVITAINAHAAKIDSIVSILDTTNFTKQS